MEHLQYPIGREIQSRQITAKDRRQFIQSIKDFPEQMERECKNLSNAQLNTPYRPAGWSLRQLVHHCSDSHLNAFMRFKLALTEDNPSILPYDEKRWAELDDSAQLSIEPALMQIHGIHQRWAFLMEKMSEKDWQKTYFHPEHQTSIKLESALASYDWHCRHHLAHILALKKRNFDA